MEDEADFVYGTWHKGLVAEYAFAIVLFLQRRISLGLTKYERDEVENTQE